MDYLHKEVSFYQKSSKNWIYKLIKNMADMSAASKVCVGAKNFSLWAHP